MKQHQILAIVNDEGLRSTIEGLLKAEGYDLLFADGVLQAFFEAHSNKPGLILIQSDNPQIEKAKFCEYLRQDKRLRHTPVVMLIPPDMPVSERIGLLKCGADEYISNSSLDHELIVRVNRLIARTDELLSANPLTNLPGNYAFEREIIKRLTEQCIFSVCAFDIDNFKAYNDYYGYKRGDDVLKFLSRLIFESVCQNGNSGDSLIHNSGDDFFVITTPYKIEAICGPVLNNFKLIIPQYYDQSDIENGYIAGYDREGVKHKFPIMSLSVAIASNENRSIAHFAQLSDIIKELKNYICDKPGNVFKDRRRDIMLSNT